MEFKDRLKELRKRRDLTQMELANKIGVSVSLVNAWENGQRLPSIEKQEAIADIFNVTLDYLFGRDDGSIYYFDPEVAEYAEFLRSNPEYRVLFDATRRVSKDDIEFVAKLLEKVVKDD